MNPESLKDLWTSVFRRKGQDGVYTRLFENLSSSQRKNLHAAQTLKSEELPVIASIEDADNWLLLTTDRLLWSIAGQRRELPVTAISDAKADLNKMQRTQITMLELEEIEIKTVSGELLTIVVEPGEPLSGIWAVLKNIGNRNRKASSH